MNKIAILYMCTGPYIGFWKAFFDSFEEYFLKESEKHYFVYTDSNEIYQESNLRVHKVYLAAEPWPLPTLLKFHRFLDMEKELLKYDYIYHSNANIKCADEVTEKEFLPQLAAQEKLIFTAHSGCFSKKKYNCPYDRNRHSLAYVPYNMGKAYVYGAMNGGIAGDYINFMKEIDKRIIEDLKVGRIAKWHDESYINHYAVTHSNYKVLDPGFCYPVGFELPYKKKIIGVPKTDVFDVNQFKGYYTHPQYSLGKRCIKKIDYIMTNKVLPIVCYGRDAILKRKPAE